MDIYSLMLAINISLFRSRNVIDTAFLYEVSNEPNACASLRDISQQILGWKLEDTHDSVQDARASLYIAAYYAIYGKQNPVQRSSALVSAGKNCQLLIHRLPDYCDEESIMTMITSYTHIVPLNIQEVYRQPIELIKGDVPAGKATIVFTSKEHRDLSFTTLPGPDRPDKQGRSQKRVYLKTGGYVCVRMC